MKYALYAFVFLCLGVVVLAEPTTDEIALVNTYIDMDFSIVSIAKARTPDKDFGSQKYYQLDNSMLMWIFPTGYVIITVPDKISISISYSGVSNYAYEKGEETGRSFSLQSGRTCEKPAGQELVWSLAKEKAPDFSLKVLGATNKKVQLSSLVGKYVLLDFWASWCEPCMRYLPETEALYKKFKDKGLVVLGINIEGDEKKAATAVASLGLSFPILMSESDDKGKYNWTAKQMTDYKIHSVPHMVLIDKQGIVQKMGFLYENDIQALLGK